MSRGSRSELARRVLRAAIQHGHFLAGHLRSPSAIPMVWRPTGPGEIASRLGVTGSLHTLCTTGASCGCVGVRRLGTGNRRSACITRGTGPLARERSHLPPAYFEIEPPTWCRQASPLKTHRGRRPRGCGATSQDDRARARCQTPDGSVARTRTIQQAELGGSVRQGGDPHLRMAYFVDDKSCGTSQCCGRHLRPRLLEDARNVPGASRDQVLPRGRLSAVQHALAVARRRKNTVTAQPSLREFSLRGSTKAY